MRPLLLLLALLCAGCGVLDDTAPVGSRGPDPAVYGPREAVPGASAPIDVPELQSPSRTVARRLASGAIGVVDITGTVGVRPRVLETANGARLEGLRWERWGKSGAIGRGELRSLECQPTCANGSAEMIPATVELTGVRECSGTRYFMAAAVRLTNAPQPASYVRAPC